MSENTKPRGCGRREVIGHGQNHFCGDELWGEVVYCDSCNLKAAKARIAELEADLAAMGGEAERESLRQRAAAWGAVTAVLGEVCPEWIAHPGTGTESAVAAIRKLAARPEAQAGGAVAAWSFEQNDGFGDWERRLSYIKPGADQEKFRNVRPLYATPPAPVVPEGWRITPYTGSFDDGKWEVYAPCGSGGAVSESDIRHFAVRMLLDHLATQCTKENDNAR